MIIRGDATRIPLPDCSVDAVVTDPPYGLEFMGKEWDRFAPAKTSAGRASFMGEPDPGPWSRRERVSFGGDNGRRNERCELCGKWRISSNRCSCDEPVWEYRPRQAAPPSLLAFQAWCTEWAAECFRVLKPGGHLLAFGGTRTYHRMTCAIEDAGFEVRDCLAWLYGQGFPKSLDVSKALDKARKDEPEWQVVGAWLKARRERAGHTRQSLAPLLAGHKNLDSAAANVSNWENGLGFPTWDRWEELRGLLGFGDEMDAEVWRLNGRKGRPGEAWDQREVIGLGRAGIVPDPERGPRHTVGGHAQDFDITAPATPEAEQWQGWGTALKPAHEPIVLARKPLTGTIASNVLRWGTGALNVDGCRVEHASEDDLAISLSKNPGRDDLVTSKVYGAGRPQQSINTAGRWPPNVAMDEEAARLLDEQSGERRPGEHPPKTGRNQIYGQLGGWGNGVREVLDGGGASRFFYVAKASRAERNAGLEAGKVNDHPTVKSLALMRWLVRLVTPPNGLVLDPFLGSGTTLLACAHEGMRGIGIEREAEYVEIAKGRLSQPIQAGMF